ncbi:hypothetical protein [Nonomuraea rubra]|uniref:hypothetical protein n=1 Tax=Nonomuraea rubra TaxID=46180 RepID=UPI0033C74AFF
MTEQQTTEAPAEQAGVAPLDDFGFDVDDAAEAELAHLLAELGDEPAEAPVDDTAAAADPVDAAAAAPEADPVDEPVDEPAAAPEAPSTPPPTVEEARLAAEELAMLEALKSWVADELKAAKERHKGTHAAYVNAGGNRAIPLRLNGVEIGTWNVADATTELVWDDEAVRAYVSEHSPHNLYEVVDGVTAARYDDVVEYIRLTHPELIKTEVRPAFLTVLAQQLDDEGHLLLDETTGEAVKLGKHVKVDSDGSGRPGWKRPKGKPNGREQLVAAWRRGEFKVEAIEAPPAT